MIGTKSRLHQRFPGGTWPLLPLLLAAACGGGGGGGGGGGDTTPPTLVAAAFVGAGATPAAGERVVLFFSEDVQVLAGSFDATDVTLAGSDTFGAGATLVAQSNPRTVAVVLGTAPALTPGSSTVAIGAGNDLIADLAGNLATAGGGVGIGLSDGTAPTITNLTIAGVDDALNGTGAAGGMLQVPRTGFTIDLAYTDTGFGVDPAQNVISASVAVSTASGVQAPGTNLRPFLTPVTLTTAAASYALPATTVFPEGPVTLSATVVDSGGLGATAITFACTVRNLTAAVQPFETNVNATQVWFLDLSRDIESFTVTSITGGSSVDITSISNGRSDFVDLLFVVGLQSSTPIGNVSGGADSNAVVLALFRDALQAECESFYAGAKVTFTFTQPSGTFPASSVAYGSLGYSQICIGGSADSPGVLGVAIFDPSNATQNDNCLLNFGGSTRLGVFVHTIVDSGMGPPSVSQFRQTFDPFAPAHGGTPIGDDGNDGQRLTGALQDARATQIATAIADLARFVGVVTAHECGHSVGLVVDGAMPLGLYGGDATNFPGSTTGHIRTQALFPGGGTNIMSPQLSYGLATHPNTAFNSLNLAYLREQVFYGN